MTLGLVLATHILAVIVWLGGMFFLTVVLGIGASVPDRSAALSSWERALSRFLPWGMLSLAIILATGVTLVFSVFGGYAHIPNIHRFNMVIGIPAIVLFVYLCVVPWRRLRRAAFAHDTATAEKTIGQAKMLLATILTLGLLAAFASAVGRYYAF
jgi:uncharacterized membrane protein